VHVPVKRTGIGAIIALAVTSIAWLAGRLTGLPKSINNVVSRRNFVRNAALGAVLIVVAQLTAGFVRFFWPNKTGAFGSVLTVPASDVPDVGAQPFRYTPGKFFLVQNEDGLLAIYWRCTHLGCTVPWVESEDRFHCPCHGSIFFKDGVKESGPAPTPLQLFPINVTSSGDVQVNTGSPISRGGYDPSQATPYP
jgi:cytochrome b6-f complex iron-sulfur subunit